MPSLSSPTITARTGNKLLTWQFDRGSDFLNAIFEQWLLLKLGVKQRFSNVEHPCESGKVQTIFAFARSLLKHADLPIKMWGKAVLHVAYIMNRTPASNAGGLAPLQYRTREPLDLPNMRVFGSPAQIHVRATIRVDTKLSDRSVSGTFISHSSHGNGYIFLERKTLGNNWSRLTLTTRNSMKLSPPTESEKASLHPIMKLIQTSLQRLHMPISTIMGTNPTMTPPSMQEGNEDDNEDPDLDEAPSGQQYGRGKRMIVPRQFLHPGTSSTKTAVFLEPLPKPMSTEFQIGNLQYANLSMNMADNEHTMFLMAWNLKSKE